MRIPSSLGTPSDTKSERRLSFIEQASEGVGIAHTPSGANLLGIVNKAFLEILHVRRNPADRLAFTNQRNGTFIAVDAQISLDLHVKRTVTVRSASFYTASTADA